MKFSFTAIATLAITTPFGRAWGFVAEQEKEDREHTFARICDPRPSPPTEPSPSAFPSTTPVEDPSVPSCMPKFENFDELCENWDQRRQYFNFLAAPSCRTPCDEWEGLPEANFIFSGDSCRNCIENENGDEYCIYMSHDEYSYFYEPPSDPFDAWEEWAGSIFTFHQSGSLSSGATVQLLLAHNYSAYNDKREDLPEDYFCRVTVDEMECNSCTFFFNTSGHIWWDVDCSNTPGIDSPARLDLDSDNLYHEPPVGYGHPLFALTDRVFNGICYNQWFPEEQAPSAAPVQGNCVPTSGFDEELCDWYTASASYLQCLNPCDAWVNEIGSNSGFSVAGAEGATRETTERSTASKGIP